MLKFSLCEGKRYLEISHYDNDAELLSLHKGMRRLNENYYHDYRYKNGMWDGHDPFIINNRYIGTGLWKELVKYCEDGNHKYELTGMDAISDAFEFDLEEFKGFVKKLLKDVPDKKIQLRAYQLEAAVHILKNKYCTAELATSAGKTIIFFLVVSYLKWKGLIDKNNKFVLVVPKIGLLKQTKDKFEIDYNNGMVPLNIALVGGKKNKFKQEIYDECDMLIISYQSMNHRKNDFFKPIRHMGIDEAHTSNGKSIPDALLKCNDLICRFGLSGTIKVKEKYSTLFKIQEHLGPLVMRYSAKQLIDDGYSPNVLIKMLYLNYTNIMNDDIIAFRKLIKEGNRSDVAIEDWGKMIYNQESVLVRENEYRLNFITKLVNKLDNNKLILFNDVKTGYGKRIYESIKEDNPNTFYIDGSVDEMTRDKYQEVMENNLGVTIVASYGTFSTGIDLENLHYIILAESYKAEILIRQTIGRGMRHHASKEAVVVIDIIDTFGKYGKKHAVDREKIYKKQSFTIKKHEIFLK